jgi:hypothetical protein
MALRPKGEAQASATDPKPDLDHAYWRWLEHVRAAFRKACQGDSRLMAGAEAKAMAKGIAADLAAESDARKRFAMVLELARRKVPTLEEEAAAADLFRRRRAVRDALAQRLGKPEVQPWDDFYNVHSARARIPYIGELLIELGAITAPGGSRPSQRRPIDDPTRQAEADANAEAWIGATP